MIIFYYAGYTVLFSKFRKTFLLRGLSKVLVYICPFVVFPVGSSNEIICCVANVAGLLELHLCVLFYYQIFSKINLRFVQIFVLQWKRDRYICFFFCDSPAKAVFRLFSVCLLHICCSL